MKITWFYLLLGPSFFRSIRQNKPFKQVSFLDHVIYRLGKSLIFINSSLHRVFLPHSYSVTSVHHVSEGGLISWSADQLVWNKLVSLPPRSVWRCYDQILVHGRNLKMIKCMLILRNWNTSFTKMVRNTNYSSCK